MAKKVYIEDVPEVSQMGLFLGVTNDYEWATIDSEKMTPYKMKLLSPQIFYLNRPLEEGYEIGFFRLSTSRPKNGYKTNSGWKLCRHTNAHFNVKTTPTLISKSGRRPCVYSIKENIPSSLIQSFAVRDAEKNLINVYNNRRRFTLDTNPKGSSKEVQNKAVLKLGYAVIKMLTNGREKSTNGLYEVCSNIASFKLILPKTWNGGAFVSESEKWYNAAYYQVM